MNRPDKRLAGIVKLARLGASAPSCYRLSPEGQFVAGDACDSTASTPSSASVLALARLGADGACKVAPLGESLGYYVLNREGQFVPADYESVRCEGAVPSRVSARIMAMCSSIISFVMRSSASLSGVIARLLRGRS